MLSNGRRNNILVVIPAYNEGGAVRRVVQDVQTAVQPRQVDILVVDDGSLDNTVEEAKIAGAFVVSHPFNLCIGGTFQTGLLFAKQRKYAYVVRVDGDGQHHCADINRILTPLSKGEADVVICSRFLGQTIDMDIPWARLVGIRFFAWLVSKLTKNKASDTTSGFIGLNRKAIEVLSTYMPQDYPEVEGRVILHKAGLKTLEIPTNMKNRTAGISSINSWRSFYYAIKVSTAALMTAMKEVAVK